MKKLEKMILSKSKQYWFYISDKGHVSAVPGAGRETPRRSLAQRRRRPWCSECIIDCDFLIPFIPSSSNYLMAIWTRFYVFSTERKCTNVIMI